MEKGSPLKSWDLIVGKFPGKNLGEASVSSVLTCPERQHRFLPLQWAAAPAAQEHMSPPASSPLRKIAFYNRACGAAISGACGAGPEADHGRRTLRAAPGMRRRRLPFLSPFFGDRRGTNQPSPPPRVWTAKRKKHFCEEAPPGGLNYFALTEGARKKWYRWLSLDGGNYGVARNLCPPLNREGKRAARAEIPHHLGCAPSADGCLALGGRPGGSGPTPLGTRVHDASLWNQAQTQAVEPDLPSLPFRAGVACRVRAQFPCPACPTLARQACPSLPNPVRVCQFFFYLGLVRLAHLLDLPSSSLLVAREDLPSLWGGVEFVIPCRGGLRGPCPNTCRQARQASIGTGQKLKLFNYFQGWPPHEGGPGGGSKRGVPGADPVVDGKI
eukprot:gene22285-biopygen10240